VLALLDIGHLHILCSSLKTHFVNLKMNIHPSVHYNIVMPKMNLIFNVLFIFRQDRMEFYY